MLDGLLQYPYERCSDERITEMLKAGYRGVMGSVKEKVDSNERVERHKHKRM